MLAVRSENELRSQQTVHGPVRRVNRLQREAVPALFKVKRMWLCGGRG